MPGLHKTSHQRHIYFFYPVYHIQHLAKKKKAETQFEETKQGREPDPDMEEILEVLYQNFKITVINILREKYMEKVCNVQEQMEM